MSHQAAVPFNLKRSDAVLSGTDYTSTTEIIHGLLRLDDERLVIQWRLSRQTDEMSGGMSMRSEKEVEAVREIVLPLSAVAGAVVRRSILDFWSGPRLVLRAADLRAFDALAGEGGLKLAHPAEVVLRLRRADLLAGEEFAAELTLALAQRGLRGGDGEGPPALNP